MFKDVYIKFYYLERIWLEKVLIVGSSVFLGVLVYKIGLLSGKIFRSRVLFFRINVIGYYG